ncbi:MAG: A/G-specific adenine glycosylase [Verrucomicrobiales bacterium]|nr:A/G-specific adenine glycosylase [Verrucomicrobiales bacterium]
MNVELDGARAHRISKKIVDWFMANARDLPWRHTLDPYAIWISEIMLQQTQVKTVVPYWNRWMKRLPTVEKLAHARETTVLKLWEGLGYYSRVRNAQRAARRVDVDLGGSFPNTRESISKLPGIGPYTSGAIASIAFNEPAPIVDGNVMRVLTRLFGMNGDPKESETNEKLWTIAKVLVDAASSIRRFDPQSNLSFSGPCSALNQGLMELGATICKPKQPACKLCPMRGNCIAQRDGLTDQIPDIAKRAATTRRYFFAFVLRRGESVFVTQRNPGNVNAGFWEFPNVEVRSLDLKSEKILKTELGIRVNELQLLGDVRHSITRYRIQQRVFAGDAIGKIRKEGVWCSLDELTERPVVSAHRKLLGKLAANRG